MSERSSGDGGSEQYDKLTGQYDKLTGQYDKLTGQYERGGDNSAAQYSAQYATVGRARVRPEEIYAALRRPDGESDESEEQVGREKFLPCSSAERITLVVRCTRRWGGAVRGRFPCPVRPAPSARPLSDWPT